MCGIYGRYNFDGHPVERETLSVMSDTLKHRGPDAQGYFIKGAIAVGALRLSVIDLSQKANQPIFSRDGRFCIVYNGEVYNYIEIRDELKEKYDFISNGDTEVVLYSFIEWGQACLDKLNGMFAFAILDIERQALFLARDRFGIKPLYYYVSDKAFIFSSELKPFKYVLEDKKINANIMYNYLVFNRTDYDNNTFLEGVKRVPHGCAMTVEKNTYALHPWYRLGDHLKKGYARPEALKDDLVSSLAVHLRSDVPLGVCLSGGLDSSSIVSLLLKEFPAVPLQTFSAVYGKNIYGDESEYIDEFRHILGQRLYKTSVTADALLSDVRDFIYYIDEPVGHIAPFMHYQVMKLARHHAVVLLDGQGADETLAGYHYFFGMFFKELLYTKQPYTLLKEIFYYCLRHKSLFGFASFLYFLLPARTKSTIKISGNNSLSRQFLSQYRGDETIPDMLYSSTNLHDSLLEHFEHKLEHLLKWEDRNAMRFSLESRVPFLDHRIVEKMLASPISMVIRRGENKWILREAMKNILPEKIRNRQDKIGFDNPGAQWFREQQFKDFIYALLHSDNFRALPFFDQQRCCAIYRKHLNHRIDASRQIWKWINVTLWHDAFIKNG